MIDANIIVSLISALIAVESGGDPNAVGDNGEAVGILQIHKCVVDDVNRWLKGQIHYSYDNRKSYCCSVDICRYYLKYYGYDYEINTGKSATAEVLARIWNGGPNGWKKKSTEKYWLKVSTEMGKQK